MPRSKRACIRPRSIGKERGEGEGEGSRTKQRRQSELHISLTRAEVPRQVESPLDGGTIWGRSKIALGENRIAKVAVSNFAGVRLFFSLSSSPRNCMPCRAHAKPTVPARVQYREIRHNFTTVLHSVMRRNVVVYIRKDAYRIYVSTPFGPPCPSGDTVTVTNRAIFHGWTTKAKGERKEIRRETKIMSISHGIFPRQGEQTTSQPSNIPNSSISDFVLTEKKTDRSCFPFLVLFPTAAAALSLLSSPLSLFLR